MSIPLSFRHQHLNGLTHWFLTRVSEHPLRLRVYTHDPSSAVQNGNGISGANSNKLRSICSLSQKRVYPHLFRHQSLHF
jgi:hypothetical protein